VAQETHPRAIAVRCEAVAFSYGETKVLENVTFHIHTGEFAALIGPNGSGKTTLLRLILGLARPDEGWVQIMGKAPDSARSMIGYVPQNPAYDPVFPLSVMEAVRMGRLRGNVGRYTLADQAATERALALADVADLAKRPYAALSGGQRRRVLVARALAAEPGLLVLDEPTANMDGESERRLYDALKELKKTTTVLVVTHDTGFVSDLTDVVLCVGGRDGSGSGVVRHASVPAGGGAVPGVLGEGALRVLHDTVLPEDGCFERESEQEVGE